MTDTKVTDSDRVFSAEYILSATRKDNLPSIINSIKGIFKTDGAESLPVASAKMTSLSASLSIDPGFLDQTMELDADIESLFADSRPELTDRVHEVLGVKYANSGILFVSELSVFRQEALSDIVTQVVVDILYHFSGDKEDFIIAIVADSGKVKEVLGSLGFESLHGNIFIGTNSQVMINYQSSEE